MVSMIARVANVALMEYGTSNGSISKSQTAFLLLWYKVLLRSPSNHQFRGAIAAKDRIDRLNRGLRTDGKTLFARQPVTQVDNDAWKSCLGFTPEHVVAKTLSATTQLVPTVEAKTREIMRDHLQKLLPELMVQRVNDVRSVDTFFSSLPTVQGFKCWNLYCFRRTGLDVAILTRRRSQSPTTFCCCGTLTIVKSDYAPEFKVNVGWITCRQCRFVLRSQKHIIQTLWWCFESCDSSFDENKRVPSQLLVLHFGIGKPFTDGPRQTQSELDYTT